MYAVSQRDKAMIRSSDSQLARHPAARQENPERHVRDPCGNGGRAHHNPRGLYRIPVPARPAFTKSGIEARSPRGAREVGVAIAVRFYVAKSRAILALLES
jgi:hypothetical protein